MSIEYAILGLMVLECIICCVTFLSEMVILAMFQDESPISLGTCMITLDDQNKQ